jgi:DNA replication protein DnaC
MEYANQLSLYPSESLAAQDSAARLRQRLRNIIPAEFLWAHFGSALLPERVSDPVAVSSAMLVMTQLASSSVRGVVISGPAGSGKTSLACAMVQSLLSTEQCRLVAFVRAIDLGRSRAIAGYGRESEDVQRSKAASFLVLDDLGSEESSGIATIRDVVHYRFDEGKPTVYTTWLNRGETVAKYGEGTARRITERAAEIHLRGQNNSSTSNTAEINLQ